MAPPKLVPDLTRLTLAVTGAQHTALGREAARQRISVAELVRRLLDEWMRKGTGA